MTDREDEILDLYKVHAYLPYDAENNPLTPFGNFAKGYELAWQARGELDAVRIKELEAEIAGQFDYKIKCMELTAKLYKAKEALKCIDEDLVNPVHYILVKEALQELDK